MYARVIKFTFVNQFSKEATTSLLNNLVTKKGFSQGMIFRVTIDTSETQRYSVTVWPNKQGSDKTWKSFAENVLTEIKATGAKVETTFGPIDELNVSKDFDFSKYNF
jgi:hypothetical protein